MYCACLKRSVRYGENYRDVTRSFSSGYPLSPLMAALFLRPLDDVKQVSELLKGLLLEKHPDKTFIGRAVREITLFSYYITPWAISVSQDTWNRMKQRIAWLYEQGAGSLELIILLKCIFKFIHRTNLKHPWHYDQKNRRAGLGVKKRPGSIVAYSIIAPSVALTRVIKVLHVIPHIVAD